MTTTTSIMNTTMSINTNFLESLLPEDRQGIISTVIENDCMVADNHRDGEIIKVDGLVILGNGEICPIFHKSSRYWSLNSLYISENDGKVHLSTWSVGGTMMAGELTKSVEQYNKSIWNFLESQKIVGYIEF